MTTKKWPPSFLLPSLQIPERRRVNCCGEKGSSGLSHQPVPVRTRRGHVSRLNLSGKIGKKGATLTFSLPIFFPSFLRLFRHVMLVRVKLASQRVDLRRFPARKQQKIHQKDGSPVRHRTRWQYPLRTLHRPLTGEVLRGRSTGSSRKTFRFSERFLSWQMAASFFSLGNFRWTSSASHCCTTYCKLCRSGELWWKLGPVDL